jgi:hypothetical protein
MLQTSSEAFLFNRPSWPVHQAPALSSLTPPFSKRHSATALFHHHPVRVEGWLTATDTLAYGLISFSVGAILGSSLNTIARVIPAILWIIPAIPLALLNAGPYFIIGSFCYLVVSIAIGFWASRRIGNGRLRIILYFVVGYVLGSVVGPIGTIAGAVLGAVLAKRSLPTPNRG